MGLPATLIALGLAGSTAAAPVAAAHSARSPVRAHRHAVRHTVRRHGFPVPTCRWVPASLIAKKLDLKVRALPGIWSTQIAPVLTCGFVERNPELQFGLQPIVTVQFRELQRFHANGWAPVRKLGTCVRNSSCPDKTGTAAYQLIRYTTSNEGSGNGSGTTTSPTGTTTTPTGTTTTSTGTTTTPTGTTPTPTTTTTTTPTPTRYVSGVALRVEDGLNFLQIVVDNPDGSLSVKSEAAAVQSLARVLLPLFRWH